MIERFIWIAPLPVLALTALLCWLLSARVPTRRLGYGAVIGVLLALACLVAGRSTQSTVLEISGRPWVTAYSNLPTPVAQARMGLLIDGLSFGLISLVLLGSAFSLLTLAQSLGATLRGYGRLWSALLVMVLGVIIAVAATDLLLLAFGWGITLLGVALARRVVGGEEQRAPVTLGLGMLGLLALLAGIEGLVVRSGDPTAGNYALTDIGATINLGTWLALMAAVLVSLGLPPFGRGFNTDERTPPLLHGSLLALGTPILGSYLLLRLLDITLGRWSSSWLIGLGVIGALGLIVGAAAALRATRFGPLLGAQTVAQWGLFTLVISTYDPTLSLEAANNAHVVVVAVLLTLTTCWSTLLSALALGVLERRSGSDQIGSQPLLSRPLRSAGFTYAMAALAGAGFPPLLGFWARYYWLAHQPTAFIIPIVLGGSVLLALSYMGPLALFWRIQPAREQQEAASGTGLEPGLLLATAPLILWMLVPELFNRILVLPAVQAIDPLLGQFSLSDLAPSWIVRVIEALALALIGFNAMRAYRGRQLSAWTGGEALDQNDGTPHVPQALGFSLRGLSLLLDPQPALSWLGQGLERLSRGLAWASQAFDGRYYLTGILIAALTLMLLLVQ